MVKNRCKNGDHYWVEAFVSPVIEHDEVVGYQSVRTKASQQQVKQAEALYAKMNADSSVKISHRRRLKDMSFFSRLATVFVIAGFLPLFGGLLFSLELISHYVLIGIEIIAPLLLITALIYFKKHMINPIKAAVEISKKMSAGDLKQDIAIDSQDEVGQLSLALKLLQARLNMVIGKLTENSYETLVVAEKLNHASTASYQQMIQQMSDTAGVSTAITQMSAAIQEVASSSESTSLATESASAETAKGTELVEMLSGTVHKLVNEVTNTSNVIDELHNKSQDVTNIIATISAIAEQTNLLALNAAIEAARAGEQGRGFAVVADEVRNLAVKTQDATSEIHRVLEDMHSNINQAVGVMEQGKEQATIATEQSSETLSSLSEIRDEISNVNLMISQIASSATEQAATSMEISTRMQSISTQTADTMSLSQMNSGVSNTMTQSTKEIMKDFSYFDHQLDVNAMIQLAESTAQVEVAMDATKQQQKKDDDIDLF